MNCWETSLFGCCINTGICHGSVCVESVTKYVKLRARNSGLQYFHKILTWSQPGFFHAQRPWAHLHAWRGKNNFRAEKKDHCHQVKLETWVPLLLQGQQSLCLDSIIKKRTPLFLRNRKRCSFQVLSEKTAMPLSSAGRVTSWFLQQLSILVIHDESRIKTTYYVHTYLCQLHLGNNESSCVYTQFILIIKMACILLCSK